MQSQPFQANATSGNKRAAEVLALGEIFSAFGGAAVARQVIAANGGATEFHRKIGERINSASSFDRAIGCSFSAKDLASFSLVDMALGRPGVHREAAAEIYRSSGVVHDASGSPIPWSILTRDFSMGVASEAGNLADAAARPLEYLRDPLRAALSLGKLGALVTPGFKSNFAIPRFTTDVSAGFVTETGATSESQPGTGLVNFAATRLGGYVEVSQASLISGGPAIEAWLTRCLRGIVIAQLESGAINGSGSGSNPLGVRNTGSIGSVVGGTNGALLNWSHIVDLENVPGLANADESEFGGYLVNTKVRKHCKITQKAAGLPFIWESGPQPINGYRAAVSSNVPGNLTKGTSTGVCSSVIFSTDWSTLLVPIFGAPDILIDRRTLASTGLVRIIINVWAASGVLQPANFSVMDDALTS